MHKSSQVKFVLEGRGYSSVVGAAQLVFRFILRVRVRLCLSACPGDGQVKKIVATPLRIISGTALSVMDFDIKF